jgi:CRISPR/Cas system-associated protein Cas10 (large subunit of type III CRISPR-Cas system)
MHLFKLSGKIWTHDIENFQARYLFKLTIYQYQYHGMKYKTQPKHWINWYMYPSLI